MRNEPVVEGAGWRIRRFICTAEAGERPFEERHEGFSLSIVSRGTFEYRAGAGRASLIAGAFLLGNHGVCFQCSHTHSGGDECLSFQYDADCWEEVVSAVPGIRCTAFPHVMHPPDWALCALQAQAEVLRLHPRPEESEELAFRIAGAVISRAHATDMPGRVVSPRDRGRIIDAGLAIEREAGELEGQALSLGALARGAGMTRYRFLRLFRDVIGMTPRQFILRSRMRLSALRLSTSSDPIAKIAFESGFGDLSTFNRQFRRAMGVSPSAFRKAGGNANFRIDA